MVNNSIKIVAFVLQVVFLALKLTNTVAWPWLLVLTPAITYMIVVVLAFAIVGFWLIYALNAMLEGDDNNDTNN